MAETHPETKHESRDINIKLTSLLGVGTLLFLLLLSFCTYWLIGYNRDVSHVVDAVYRPNSRLKEDPALTFPEPRLQRSPSEDLARYKAQQRDLLRSYAWIDKSAGQARVPIAVAKRVALRKLGASAPQPQQPGNENGVGVDSRLGEKIDVRLPFADSTGLNASLGSYLGKEKPALLVLAYYGCPTLCGLTLNHLFKSLKDLPLQVGRDYTLLVVSIDPSETSSLAAEKKSMLLEKYQMQDRASGIHFLTGKEPAIAQLAEQLGFRFTYDAQRKEYAHPAGLTVVSPPGIVSRYLFGLEFSPQDVQFALTEASQGKVWAGSFESLLAKALLFCYRYDPIHGTYSFYIYRLVQMLTGLVLIVVLTLVARSIWLETKKGAAARKGREP